MHAVDKLAAMVAEYLDSNAVDTGTARLKAVEDRKRAAPEIRKRDEA